MIHKKLYSYLYLLFAELGWPHNPLAIHPLPLKLQVDSYESFSNRGLSIMQELSPGFHEVETDENHKYVIGLLLYGKLYPLVASRADLNNNYGRVKLLINGNNANVIVPILKEDHLNSRFYKKTGPNKYIRAAEIPEIE